MLRCLIEYKDKNHRYLLHKLINSIIEGENSRKSYPKYKNIGFKIGIDLKVNIKNYNFQF